MNIVYLNGNFLPLPEASISPTDAGFLLGAGVFETMRVEGGQLLFHAGHFARLARGARLLEIPHHVSSEDLLAICQAVIDANDLREARLRITLTCGPLKGSPVSLEEGHPTLAVAAAPTDDTLAAQREEGWRIVMSPSPRNHRSPLATIKSTSYVESYVARRRARSRGADEAIFLNTDGLLAEGAMSNLFIVRDGRVQTPPVEDGALPGIMRLKVGLMCARLSIPYEETSLTFDDLKDAEEVFMTSIILQVMPVVMVEDREVGDGVPGPVGRQLFGEHRREVEEFLATLRHQ